MEFEHSNLKATRPIVVMGSLMINELLPERSL